MTQPDLYGILSRRQLSAIGQSTARINILEGAIRSGKTLATLIAWLLYVAKAPAGELVMTGKNSWSIHRNLVIPLQDPAIFGDLARHVKVTAGSPFGTILGRRVHVIGGNDARSENRLRGLTCAGALIDEVTLIPQEFFTQLLGRMSVPGARLFATTNPDSPYHWLKREFLERGELDLRQWHFQLDDNPSLTDEYKTAIKAEFTGLWYRRMVLGEWVAAEGAIYDMFDIRQHVLDILPTMTRWLACAIDYGTANPFHALLIGLGADHRLYVVAEWRYDGRAAHRQMTDAEYSEKIRTWLDQVQYPGSKLRGVRPEYMVIDPSAASFRQQLHRDHWSPHLADNAVLDGIRQVATLLGSGRLLIHSSCKYLIGELTTYVWDDSARLKGEDRPVKVNDHGVDALRYGIMTTRNLWRNALIPAAPGIPHELTFQAA
jgi:PBSX family phage terminase large subunit